MADIPIIFSAPMVRALLDGRKTMTRRLAWKPLNVAAQIAGKRKRADTSVQLIDGVNTVCAPSPWQKVRPGDRLWVREAWCAHSRLDNIPPRKIPAGQVVLYEADNDRGKFRWAGRERRSFHMLRWASRLTLVVIATKVERLQAITVDDIRREGLVPDTREKTGEGAAMDMISQWIQLWDDLHGPGSWDLNPELVAISFTVYQQNVDAMTVAA